MYEKIQAIMLIIITIVSVIFLVIHHITVPTYEDFDIRSDMGETQPKYYGHPSRKAEAPEWLKD